jgi:uncharacterized surface protein with fasciclin (FAS1) repeats
MRKRVVSFSKVVLTCVGLLGFTVFTGCGDDDDVTPPFTGTIYDLINDAKFKQSASVPADKALDSLAKYIETTPLKALLDGSTKYTFFAPSNQAFINLLATPGFPGKISDISPALIAGVFSYHATAGELTKSALTPTGSGAGLTSLYKDTNPCTGAQTDQVIKVNANGTLLTGSTNLEVEIVVADNKTTENGVMHVVESVMIPPSIGTSLTPILGKHTATILLGSSFSYLAKAMTKADCGEANPANKIATVLASAVNTSSVFTVFLPPDPVFAGTATALGLPNADALIAAFTAAQWRNILLNHVVSGTNNLSSLTNGTELTTLLGTKLIVTDVPVSAQTPTGKVLSVNTLTTINCPILLPNLAVSNGVDHVVGKILFP